MSLYFIALGVNLGLLIGLYKRTIPAFFIPWIVVNLVFILAFFSLFLGESIL